MRLIPNQKPNHQNTRKNCPKARIPPKLKNCTNITNNAIQKRGNELDKRRED